jgi:hypothetical protein
MDKSTYYYARDHLLQSDKSDTFNEGTKVTITKQGAKVSINIQETKVPIITQGTKVPDNICIVKVINVMKGTRISTIGYQTRIYFSMFKHIYVYN